MTDTRELERRLLENGDSMKVTATKPSEQYLADVMTKLYAGIFYEAAAALAAQRAEIEALTLILNRCTEGTDWTYAQVPDEIAAQRERIAVLEDALNRHQAAFMGRRPSTEHMDADEYREAHCAAFMHAADVLRGAFSPPSTSAQREEQERLQSELSAIKATTYSHVDGRDLLHELQPNGAHHIDIVVRINGEDRRYQGDWLKRLTHARDGHNMGEYADNPKLRAMIEARRVLDETSAAGDAASAPATEKEKPC